MTSYSNMYNFPHLQHQPCKLSGSRRVHLKPDSNMIIECVRRFSTSLDWLQGQDEQSEIRDEQFFKGDDDQEEEEIQAMLSEIETELITIRTRKSSRSEETGLRERSESDSSTMLSMSNHATAFDSHRTHDTDHDTSLTDVSDTESWETVEDDAPVHDDNDHDDDNDDDDDQYKLPLDLPQSLEEIPKSLDGHWEPYKMYSYAYRPYHHHNHHQDHPSHNRLSSRSTLDQDNTTSPTSAQADHDERSEITYWFDVDQEDRGPHWNGSSDGMDLSWQHDTIHPVICETPIFRITFLPRYPYHEGERETERQPEPEPVMMETWHHPCDSSSLDGHQLKEAFQLANLLDEVDRNSACCLTEIVDEVNR